MFRVLFLILILTSSVAYAQTKEIIMPMEVSSYKLDEFQKATNGYVKMKMEMFFERLKNNPEAEGVIINYGTAREIAKREKQIRVSIIFRKYDAQRITFVRGGFRQVIKTELWIVPPGAVPPTPSK